MTAATHTQSLAPAASLRMPLQWVTGFFFAFRNCITYVAFQSNPTAGSAFTLFISAALFAAALFYTLGDEQFSLKLLLRSRILRWMAAYLLLTGLSLFWTGAESPLIAAGYWTGLAMEVATVLLLAKGRDIPHQVDAMFKGFVIGAVLVAAIAWLSPTLPDLRIGHDQFLVPNLVGLYCALGFLISQHLAFQNRLWKWCCIALGIALFRSISKTAIIAFLLAETFFLITEKNISRSAKIKIAAATLTVMAAFSGLATAYLTDYSTHDTSPESLTGRTFVWAAAFEMGLQKPWFGHGLYSFRSLIPVFGTFQPWHAHNEILQQFFEYGILGVVLIVGLYLSLLRTASRSPERSFGRLATVLVVFSIIHGLADTANFGPSLPAWIFAALALALIDQSTVPA